MIGWLSNFFLNPLLAFGGIAVASPVLIHILSKRRYQRIRWAAMQFLLEAQKRNRRRVRLEQLILLLLRCAAVLFLALMIARPFMRPGMLASILGAGGRSERIILLDDSYSMGYRPHNGTAAGESIFDRGKQAVGKIASWVADESSGDALTLVLASHPEQPSISLANLSDENVQKLKEHLETLPPSQSARRVEDVVQRVADLVRGSTAQANAVVYVVSDFQRKDWVHSADGTADKTNKPRSAIAALGDLSTKGSAVKLVLVNVGDEAEQNAAITSLVSRQPQVVAGVSARFDVGVSNYSDKPLSHVELGIAISHHQLPPALIEKIDPWQTVIEPIEVTFPQDGPDYLQVELSGAELNNDGLTLDNKRASSVDVAPAVSVLIVDGAPNNDPYRDEVYLLRTALRPPGRASSGNELTVIEDHELDGMELTDFHIVILANVARLSKTGLHNLETFVSAGGGLLIFSGDQVEPDFYNRELYRDGAGPLPAPLTEVIEASGNRDPFAITHWDDTHPVMRAFVDQLGAVLRQVRVFAYTGVDEKTLASQPGDNPTTQIAKATPASSQPSDALSDSNHSGRVLARLDDAGGSPIIVERAFGRGKCVFIGTSADQQWNDWASNFSFVPMILDLVQYSARASHAVAEAIVDVPLVIPSDASTLKPTATIRTPAYPVDPEMTVEAASIGGGPLEWRFARTNKVGLYQFHLTKTSGERLEEFAAVNPDAGESDLRAAVQSELSQSLSELPFEYVSDIEAFASASTATKNELWWPLLMAAIAALMLEQTLAWWFGKRS